MDKGSIEQRLQALEDRQAIYQLVCGYGYAVDGLNAEVVGSLYGEDGVYGIENKDYQGRAAIEDITRDEGHVERVGKGCAHISTLPHVVLDGDRASATCHTMLMQHGDGGYFAGRLSASRLELSRKPDGGWQIDRRQNYLLNGDPRAPELLANLLTGPGRFELSPRAEGPSKRAHAARPQP